MPLLVFLPIHLFSFAIAAVAVGWLRGFAVVVGRAVAMVCIQTPLQWVTQDIDGTERRLWRRRERCRVRHVDSREQARQRFLDAASSAARRAAQSAIDERVRALHDRADDSEGRIVAAIRDLLVEHQAPSTRKPAPIVSRDAPAHRTAPSLQGQGAAAAAPKNMKLQVVPAAVPYPERNGWKAPLLPPQPSQPLPPIAHAQEVQQEVQDTASIMVETAGKGGEEPRKPWAPSATPASPSAVPLTIPNRSRRGAPPTNL